MIGRTAAIERKTNETDIRLRLNLDGTGISKTDTGVGFFDHMLEQVGKHGFFDLELTARGDLGVDCHHTVEDTGIVLGQGFARALGDKAGINRYGNSTVPMDEALVMTALDFSGRGLLVFDAAFPSPKVGGLDTEMVEEFFRAFCQHAGLNLHIRMLAGKNSHHICEGIFKSFARSLCQAAAHNPRVTGVLSSKGIL
ncbi:MAG: imidazoleglycerol-phosphate dehydratase HisB [Clostridiales bacterium]|jgi:imidazoleglycerol-phosphate dehydratase|nr:imidazoleglycerol-phosphate dehydratase HisB [Clostridiales bacterium]